MIESIVGYLVSVLVAIALSVIVVWLLTDDDRPRTRRRTGHGRESQGRPDTRGPRPRDNSRVSRTVGSAACATEPAPPVRLPGRNRR